MQFIQDDTESYTNQSSLSSLLYSGLTVAFFLAGAGYLFTPESTLDGAFGVAGGPQATFLWRAIGAALLTVVPVTTFSLRVSNEGVFTSIFGSHSMINKPFLAQRHQQDVLCTSSITSHNGR
jgi:hypothetical protein